MRYDDATVTTGTNGKFTATVSGWFNEGERLYYATFAGAIPTSNH